MNLGKLMQQAIDKCPGFRAQLTFNDLAQKEKRNGKTTTTRREFRTRKTK